ncbi:hypothetical protein PGT21_020921 [Puccinia graminis f. sp. tritici]|uniref:DDE Tnp4 domain-containing protein n=1 Tax=Puccinia graminis f. sp. tritici TaxID=56615 RepID=A0A5B0QTW1_PUCGR|nr:hypothetical protein PGT21_020921 [Puccinia graminis f. sp. tritici]
MISPQVFLSEQQDQLRITQQRRQVEQDARQRNLEALLAQNSANDDRESEETVALFMAMAFLGTPGQFRQFRTYLTRADLPTIPMAHSAWAYLWKSRSDRAFITTMGIDFRTFDDLLDRFAPTWNFTTIDRADVNPNGEPQLGRRSLDAAGTLGLVLHWLCSTMSAYSLQQLFGITPAVCSRYLASGMDHLLVVLNSHPQARFLWPTTERRAKEYSRCIEKKFPMLSKCVGFIDGLNLPVLVSDDEDIQNAYYNGWTCSHYCSCILAFASDGTIMYAILNAPGSWHDSTIAEPLYDQLLHHTPPGYRVISDTAFPRKSARLQSRILAPVKRGDQLPTDAHDFAYLQLLNEQLVSARQAAEWGMRLIQGSFARLKLPLPASNHGFRLKLLQVVCQLHQLRCRSVGINQTATVYQAVWDEDRILCRDFHKMMFSDIQGRCRISRYYNGWL